MASRLNSELTEAEFKPPTVNTDLHQCTNEEQLEEFNMGSGEDDDLAFDDCDEQTASNLHNRAMQLSRNPKN